MRQLGEVDLVDRLPLPPWVWQAWQAPQDPDPSGPAPRPRSRLRDGEALGSHPNGQEVGSSTKSG